MRDVSVVLHLANGQDVVYHVGEEVEMGDPEANEPTPQALAQAAQSDAKTRKEEAVKRVARPATGRRVT